MALVSVTRMKLRRPWSVAPFALHAFRAFAQAEGAAGFLGGSVLRDRRFTFWTMTGWRGMESMRAYMLSGDHRASMPRFLDWCDEASVVDWEREEAGLPGWAEAERRMRADGRASKLRHPGPRHTDLSFHAARLTSHSPMTPRPSALAA